MKKKKTLIILKSLRKIIKPHQIIFLVILLIGNTFAWFVYSNKVSNGIDVHVRSWNVLFQSGETLISDYFYVNIPNVYPGMNNYVSTLTIENDSEVAANITYKILEARIFNNTYITEEGRAEDNNSIQDGDFSSDELEAKLLNDYPFTISFGLTSDSISQTVNNTTSKSMYSVTFSWPFESGNDELDTYWGNQAYQFEKNNSSGTSEIMLRLKIFVTQKNSGE